MPEGPLGLPRPFVSSDTIKMMAKMENPEGFNRINFDELMSRSDIIKQPPEFRVVGFEQTDFIVVDTRRDNVLLDNLNNLEDGIDDALEGSGAGGIEGDKVAVVTPKQ